VEFARPRERKADITHTTDHPPLPAADVLPNAAPDLLRRRILLAEPDKAILSDATTSAASRLILGYPMLYPKTRGTGRKLITSPAQLRQPATD
jgi:hypothetical protein